MPEENKEKTQKKRWTLKKVKTRCRTIYWQNFLLTASVVMLTLALLGSAFFALTYSYAIDERSEQMLVRMQDIHSSFKKIYTDLRVNDTKSRTWCRPTWKTARSQGCVSWQTSLRT